jgi:hypothetical protein
MRDGELGMAHGLGATGPSSVHPLARDRLASVRARGCQPDAGAPRGRGRASPSFFLVEPVDYTTRCVRIPASATSRSHPRPATRIPSVNAGPFVVTQETADFVFGSNVHLPNQCAVAITDGHDQQILVNVGLQIGVDCANSTCGAAAVIRRRASSLRVR